MDDMVTAYDPLARLPDEPAYAHRALLDYDAIGPDRTLDALTLRYQRDIEAPPTRRRKTLADWSSKWNWQERVAQAQDIRLMKERAVREAEWAARREVVREQSWDMANKLLARAQELLDQPFLEEGTIKRHGEEIPVLKPRWTMRDIATLTETYDKLARLAAGMDTDQQRIVIDGLTPDDLSNLPDEEIDKLWAKVNKKK